jgi:hypothetical protein
VNGGILLDKKTGFFVVDQRGMEATLKGNRLLWNVCDLAIN